MLKINEYKESILTSESVDAKQSDITAITNEHHEQLKALRFLYDNFLKNAELEFFDVLKEIRFPKIPNEIPKVSELPQQPSIEPPLLDYVADAENSLRSSGINIDTRGAGDIPSEPEEPSNKDSHEV